MATKRIMPGGMGGVTGPTVEQVPAQLGPAEVSTPSDTPRNSQPPRLAEPGMSEFARKPASKNGARRTLDHVALVDRLPDPELDLVTISTRLPRELVKWLKLRSTVTGRPMHALLAEGTRILVAELGENETLAAIRSEIYG